MTPNRRYFLRSLCTLFLGSVLTPRSLSAGSRQVQGAELQALLRGSWALESYTYTSNNRTYSAPDEMEAIANFEADRYDVEFSTYIGAVGVRRTRRASESGTYSVTGDRIRLFAEEASQDNELGEEFLTEVRIDGDTLNLTSMNGSVLEVWKKAA